MKDDMSLLLNIVNQVLEKHPETLSRVIATEFVSKEKFPREEIKELIADGFDKCLYEKLKNVAGFFQAEHDKHFMENLTTSYDRVLKAYFAENKSLDKKVSSAIKKYLKEMNFEQTMLEFFNSKKELFMELMVKQMFSEKGKK